MAQIFNKQKRKDILMKELSECSKSKARQLIHKSIKNQIIDMGEGIVLRKKYCPKPDVYTSTVDSEMLYRGIVSKDEVSEKPIKLVKKDDKWTDADGKVYLVTEGKIILNLNRYVFVSPHKDFVSMWLDGAHKLKELLKII